MIVNLRRASWTLLMASMMLVAHRAGAQTPQQLQQMEYERQQREYWRQQEQQRLEQQRQQQIWEENARRQQEESRRSNVPIGSGASPAMPGGAPPVGGAYQGGAQAAELEKARQIWLRRPALAADHNPLLGKWMRPRSTRGNSSDPFAQLGALLKGGACEVFFGGGGVFEFRPDRMVGSDAQTKEMELDRVEYRGDAKRVVVIPKTTLRLIVFDFEGPNRINWAGQDCELVRVGAGRTAAAPSPIQAAAPATAARANAGGAVLKLTAGFSSDGGAFSPLAGSKFIVLRHSVDVALASRGYRPPPGVSVYQGWVTACQARAPGCAQGLQGVKSDALGVLQTDPQGIARTQPISAGTYYLFGSARRGAQGMMWNVRVDLKPGDNAVTLDQRNAVALN